jgi:glyoxylase-like metal-dependent hydrolase (beta-lactamase superfamily II)
MNSVNERTKYEEPLKGLYLLDLPQSGRSGFHHFISSWFFTDMMGRRILVDPGPANTIPLLLDKLSSITEDIDLVLLTHIHLDHSGGIGQFCERFKNAKVLVHPKAIKHLINPGKLWRSSLDVLGDIAEMYGAPAALNSEYLIQDSEIADINIIETPGHSPHHLSFILPFQGKRLLFAGEAAGLHVPMRYAEHEPYLRPTTPPKFDGLSAQNSLVKIEDALQGDEILCYSHWGLSLNPQRMIPLAKRQIDDWISIISKMIGETEEVIMNHIITHDTLLKGYSFLPEDLRERESIFIKNSVKGILKYLQEKNCSLL